VKRTLVVVLLVAAGTGVPAYAHHSFAATYVEEKSVSIEGELVQFELRNPHSWVYVMAKDENGEMQKYGAEWANATRLKQGGMTEETLKPGDIVTITGAPGRKVDEHRIHLKKIVRPADGWTWGGGGGPGGRGGPGRGGPPAGRFGRR
jgi:hypothetical protein